MDCKVFRKEIDELETGQPLSTSAQAHVNACLNCQSFQAERLSLRQLVGSLGPVSAPPDFDFRLRARLAAAQSNGSNSFHRARFAPSLKAISVAASLVVLIAAAVVFKPFQSGPSNLPVASNNPSQAQPFDAQPAKLKDNDAQVAAASHNDKAVAAETDSNTLKTNAPSPSREDVETIARAKAARGAVQTKTERPPVISNDFAFRGTTPVITPAGPSATNLSRDNATASLQVPAQPVKVLLHDRQGAMRSVVLGPVIFGSQDFLERSAERHAPAADVEGIW